MRRIATNNVIVDQETLRKATVENRARCDKQVLADSNEAELNKWEIIK